MSDEEPVPVKDRMSQEEKKLAVEKLIAKLKEDPKVDKQASETSQTPSSQSETSEGSK